jgi:hypothetical protein
MKLQAQAVLRRSDVDAPLRLAGVLVAGSFYPDTPQDAWGPLHLEVGLIALAPLTPVLALDGADAAKQAMREARDQWSDPILSRADLLSWRPIDEVREQAADADIRLLIQQMTVANEERSAGTPSTPPYHRAARELERLAGRVYEATSAEERVAEDGALRRDEHSGKQPSADGPD